MAAPVGFSVQTAQGTGLGPAAQPVTTGTMTADEEINYEKLPSIPPPAPGSAPGQASITSPGGPVVSATPYNPHEKPDKNMPTVTPFASGGASTTSSITQPTNINGGGKTETTDSAYDEVDIFVPQIPSAPPGGTSTTSGGKNSGEDDDDEKPAASSGGGATSPSGTSTYEDLAARFDQLKK